MSPIDEDAFWRTLIDCKASRYLTASEVQFLLKYRDSVEATHAENERRRAEFDNMSRLLAAACSSAPPSEEMLHRLLERQPQPDAADSVVKAFVASFRLLINRAAVRESLAASRGVRHERAPAAAAAAAPASLDYSHCKKVLRKLESKAYVDAIETDLKCCQKLVSTLQSSHGHGTDGGSQHAVAEEPKPHPKHKRHSLPLPGKADGSAPAANEQVVQKLFPLQKLMHMHPACDLLNEDPAFKNGHLEEKIKYLLDLAHSRPAATTAPAVPALERQSAPSVGPPALRRTVATQCEPARRAECRDAAVSAAIRKGAKTRRRASEPAEGRSIGGDYDDDDDARVDRRGKELVVDEIDGVQDLEDGEDIVPLRPGASDRRIEALKSALAHAAAGSPRGPPAKVPSAKTEREMLLYIAKEIQDEWTHVFRDLMDDAQVPLDDVQVLKAEIEENYKDAFLQACQCLERWRRAAGSFEVQRLRKVFESRHRKDLVNYMEARVTRASGAAVVQGRCLN